MAKAQEPCVLEWMGQLNPNTKNYAYYFLRFYDWFRAKGAWEKPGQAVQWKSAREMLDEWETASGVRGQEAEAQGSESRA